MLSLASQISRYQVTEVNKHLQAKTRWDGLYKGLLEVKTYRVSIKYLPDYNHLLQENYVEYKHIFFFKM
jgi:hypothetical protein